MSAAAQYPGLGEPIKGPSALGTDPKRFWRLTWTLATTEFKLRFFDSVLGYLWSLVRPLAVFGVLYLVFTQAIDLGATAPDFAVALLLGIVLYSFLNEATSGSVRALVAREQLVRKVEFPRLAVPMSTVLASCFSLGLNMIPVVVFATLSGVPYRWSWLWTIPLLIALIFFATGLSMLLSALYVRFRDIEPIWDVILQVMFYASPIFYPISVLLEDPKYDNLGRAMLGNPFAAILQEMRHAVISPEYETVGAAMGYQWRVFIPFAIALAIFAIGYRVFSREAPRIAEDL